MRTILLLLSAQACYKAPLVPPVAPIPLEPFSRSIELPQPMIADDFQLHAVPRVLPLAPPATLVIALPSPTAGGSGTQTYRNTLRAGLIAAFLESGYHVKDAGEFDLPVMRMVNQPRFKGTSGVDVRVRSQEVERVELDLSAVRLEPLGLDMALIDPTSLWATDLADYTDLSATHFFRVFELDVSEQQRGVAGRLYYTAAQVDAFEARAIPLNIEAEDWLQRRSAFAESTVRFQQEHAKYRAACQALADRRNRSCERAPPVPELPPVPQLFSSQTLYQYLEATNGAATTRVVGKLVAELVDTSSGEVVWVGRTEVEVDPGPNAHARVIALMVARLRGV